MKKQIIKCCKSFISKSLSRSLSTTKSYTIGIIPGDGIGIEILPFAKQVLLSLSQKYNFQLKFNDYPYSCKYYLEHGKMLPEDGLESMKQNDALLLGAIGDPRIVLDHISLRGLLIPIRQQFDQYINLRPAQKLPKIPTPLKGDPNFDICVVRENTEGFGAGGRFKVGTPDEVALQTSIFTRKGIERVVDYAFQLSLKRTKKIALATKSNAMQYGMVLWDEIFEEYADKYSKQNSMQIEKYHVDALVAKLIKAPWEFDVIVASNLFGDIITDLIGAMQGSLGVPASANINPEKKFPSLFESVHGSAIDIVGRGIANPIATFEAASLMLEFLGESKAAEHLRAAIWDILSEAKRDVLTPDIGGAGTTQSTTTEVLRKLSTNESLEKFNEEHRIPRL